MSTTQDTVRNPNSTAWLNEAKPGDDGGKKSPFGSSKLSSKPATVPQGQVTATTPQGAPAPVTAEPTAAAQATSAPATQTLQQPVAPQGVNLPLPAAGQPVATTVNPSVQDQQIAGGQYASAPVATPNTSAVTTGTPAQLTPQQTLGRVLQIDDPNTKILLPGMKEPKTASQLARERDQQRNFNSQNDKLHAKEQALKAKEEALAKREQEIQLSRTAAAPQRPTPPVGYIPGDSEYASYESEVRIWEHQMANQPLLQTIAQREGEQELTALRGDVAKETYNYNDTLVGGLLTAFGFDSLEPSEQQTLRSYINQAASQRNVSFDPQAMSRERLSADKIELIQRDVIDAIQAETAQFVTGSNLAQLQNTTTYGVADPSQATAALLSNPLVPKAPEPPPLQPGTSGISAPVAAVPNKPKGFGMRSDKDKSWLGRI